MNDHEELNDLVPFYVSGKLAEADRKTLERHLEVCAECRSDLALWKAVGAVVSLEGQSAQPETNLAEKALERIHAAPRKSLITPLKRAWLILISQIPLVRREIWPASAAVIAIGIAVALLGYEVNAIQYLAPLVAAATISVIYGPESDPLFELSRSTPTSPWQILLARLTLVFCYNLAISLLGSLLLVTLLPDEVLSSIILSWLAPMAFLSSLALLLSIYIGSGNAISVVYLAYMVNLFTRLFETNSLARILLDEYAAFWSNPAALFLGSAVLAGATLIFVSRKDYAAPHAA